MPFLTSILNLPRCSLCPCCLSLLEQVLCLCSLKYQGALVAVTFWAVQLLNGRKFGPSLLPSTPDLPQWPWASSSSLVWFFHFFAYSSAVMVSRIPSVCRTLLSKWDIVFQCLIFNLKKKKNFGTIPISSWTHKQPLKRLKSLGWQWNKDLHHLSVPACCSLLLPAPLFALSRGCM